MRLLHENAIFQTVNSKVIISLFQTVRLSVLISLRNLYKSLNSIKESYIITVKIPIIGTGRSEQSVYSSPDKKE